MSLERQQQEQRAHELALRAADYAGQTHAGHSDVAARVAAAYVKAYETCMNIGRPDFPPLRPGAYYPANSVFIHKDGSVHPNPEY